MSEETSINKPAKKGGRKSSNNGELDERRAEETKLYARGWTISKIAREFDLAWPVVKADIAEYQKELRRREADGIDPEKITLAEIVKIAVSSALDTKNSNGRAGLLGKAIEASREIAILRGVRKVDGSVNISTQLTMNQGANNPYEGIDDRGIKDEFARRRHLVSSGDSKKGKGKL
jgi:hypothetical protein